MKKIFLLLLVVYSANSTSYFGNSNYDGSWVLNVSETISVNKENNAEIPQKKYVKLIKFRENRVFIVEGDIVTLKRDGEIKDGCLINARKTSMDCKKETVKLRMASNKIYLTNPDNLILVLERQ